MKKETMVMQAPYPDTHCHHFYKRISWTAIFTGAFVGVGLGFLLNLFGLTIGLSAFTVDQAGMQVIAVGGVIGILIGVIAAMVAAGYAAGYLGRLYSPQRNLGILYGFTTWSVALLLSAGIMGHLSHYVSTYSHIVVGPDVVFTQSINGNENSVITTERNATRDQHKDNKIVTKVTTTPHTLACGAFLIFALFFIGALSSCVGALWGMSNKRMD